MIFEEGYSNPAGKEMFHFPTVKVAKILTQFVTITV